MFVRGIRIIVRDGVLADDVANRIVKIRIVVISGAGGTKRGARRIAGERTGQAIQPVILVALLLPSIDGIDQIGNVATVVVGVGQLLQVVETGVGPGLDGAQAQGVGFVAPLARQAVGAVAVLVDQLGQLPLGVVGNED